MNFTSKIPGCDFIVNIFDKEKITIFTLYFPL